MNLKHNIPEYGVSEFNKIFREVLELNFGYVKIRGEISEIKSATKGQLYLMIKDNSSIISAVIWESKIKYLKIQPEVGIEIIAVGKITSWSRYKTTYQLDVDNIEIAGEGALLKLIEERRKRLTNKGIFDEKNKKTIPLLPNKIGIITSPTGAVIHDIINRLKERFPIDTDLFPTPVQGDEAPSLIIKAIQAFNSINYPNQPDVIIIARGGGSVEDLMVFNDERLVMAIFESSIPIISAIGHETDTTLVDFASDVRAPTPTAAVEIATPVRKELVLKINSWSERLSNSINMKFNYYNDQLNSLNRLLKEPSYILDNYKEKFSNSTKALFKSCNLLIKNKLNILHKNYLRLKSPLEIWKLKNIQSQNLFKNLEIQISKKIDSDFFLFKSLVRLLNSNSIDFNLKKGFVILKKSKKIIRKSTQLKKYNSLQINFIDNKVDVKIEKN